MVALSGEVFLHDFETVSNLGDFSTLRSSCVPAAAQSEQSVTFFSISTFESRHGTPPCNHPASGGVFLETKNQGQTKNNQQHAKHKHESWSFFSYRPFNVEVFCFSP